MKLGKALATGVAQERPEDQVVHDDLELHEELEDLQAPAPEEVPADR